MTNFTFIIGHLFTGFLLACIRSKNDKSFTGDNPCFGF